MQRANMSVAATETGTTETARVEQQIAAIASALRNGDHHYSLRLVAELVSWVRDGIIGLSALAADPGSTGDARWDAMIGGIAEMLVHEVGQLVPEWATAPSRMLPTWWFVTTLRSLRPTVFVDTPPALAAHGVLLSAASLRSV